jgi:hypothetical protein
MGDEAREHMATVDHADPFVLLIYPVGNSDLQLIDDDGSLKPLPRGSDFRSVVGALTGRSSPAQMPEALRAVVLNEQGELRRPAFPILTAVLRHIERERRGQLIRVIPILSDQNPPRPSDTIGVNLVFSSWLGNTQAFGDRVALAQPQVLTDNPSNYDVMDIAFSEIAARLESQIAAASTCYISATAGTPAMTFALAATFGPDARITFLYKPQLLDTVERIEHFRRAPRKRALHLLDAALARFDFDAARELLAAPGSGFDSDRDDVREAQVHLDAAASWRRELYAEAARHATVGRLHRQLPVTRELTAALSALHEPPARTEWPHFWRYKLIDIAARLQIARMQGDVPGFIIRLRHFLDVSLLYGLCWYQLSDDVLGEVIRVDDALWKSLAVDGNWYGQDFREGYQRTTLLVWRARHPRLGDTHIGEMKRWIQCCMQLRDLQLRELRNQLTHLTAVFERDHLDTFVREQFPKPRPGLPPDAGTALLMALVMRTLEALPQPAHEEVIALLDEWLTIPRRVADDHGLNEPMHSTTMRRHLAEAAYPASAWNTDFQQAVDQEYEHKIAREVGTMERTLPDRKRAVADQVTAAADAAAVETLDVARLTALRRAIEGVDASSLRAMVEISLINASLGRERGKWLLRRSFHDAAPGLPVGKTRQLADRFANASVEQRVTILQELLQ